ncbi:MAG TPA: BrnT family toxin [Gemmatimonadaceae bacterium]
MEFEFDPAKSASNQAKHGIDFNDVTALWSDALRIEVPARTTDEPRSLVVGQIAGKHWSAVITYRGSAVRIISARRSRAEEIEWYEDQGN